MCSAFSAGGVTGLPSASGSCCVNDSTSRFEVAS